MKKSLTKLIVSCAAVAAVTTAMAVSASAASYADGKVTTGIQSAAETGKQATILVYKADSAETEATAETILYIDQAAKADDLWKELNLTLADGKYVIKMGGEGAAVASEVLKVGGSDVKVGDITGGETAGTPDGNIKVNDAVYVIDYIVGTVAELTEEQKEAADAYKDGQIKVNDAVTIIDYILGSVEELPVVPQA